MILFSVKPTNTVKRQGVKEAEQDTERGRERERESERDPERRWTDPAACALLFLEKVSSEPGSLQLAPRTPAKPGFIRQSCAETIQFTNYSMELKNNGH
ncbi:EGF-like repeat and discoidin I-like domain-containing protein 3 [Platysternon megacephalum]|uniref:EGF-like repeat and discoidin I-like domain-containing protein 3 n=1 Tax=Platysternon megacephalum TaxID=55544 RepID=A0A4D9EYN7_9SAUR|nr:EGF-like repeat and discoidin I-like domain-containing protein 3 [Platysternon megacephalum]